MAMPANVTTVVVAGTFITPEGIPSTGTVSFTPSSWLTNPGANVAIPNSTVTKALGTAGDFTVTLPITDDPDLNPEGWIYTVSEVIDGVSQSYNIAIPEAAIVAGTVFLADLAPVAPAGPEYFSLASSLSIGTVSILPAGSAATANITGLAPAQILDLGIPTGPQGEQGLTGDTGAEGPQGLTGPQGDAATIEVGVVTAGTAGGTPAVTNTGTSGSAVFDFLLIPGDTGPQGDIGPVGTAATVTIGTIGTVAFPGPGTVVNSGTSSDAVLDFILVTGPQGAIGDLTAADPIAYVGNEFSLKFGAGLGTATGGTLVADFSDTTPEALGVAAAGTSVELTRGDHVHTMPSAGDVGAVGTATEITAGTALAGGGDLSASRTLDVVLSDSTPVALGAAAAGTASNPARGDHVHPTDGIVLNSLIDAAGDLIVGSADNTVGRLALGTDGQVLTVDTAGTGVAKVKWADGSGGGPIVSHYFTDGQGSVTVTVPVGKYLVTTDADDTVVSVDAASVTGKGPQVLAVASTGSSFGVSRPQIPASPDPASWTSRTSGFGTTTIVTLTYGTVFVAAGGSGVLTSSTDGTTWTTRTSGFGSSTINALTFGNSLYISGGAAGVLATSTDGTTWTTRTSGFGSTRVIRGLTSSPSLYVAVGGGTSVGSGSYLATSTDGITWTSRTSGFGTSVIYGAAFGNSVYVAGGEGGTITTSTDGTTWTTRTSNISTLLRDVGYADGVYLAFGDSGALRTSTDAVTWTTRTTGMTGTIYGFAYGDGIYLLASGDDELRSSTDAVTWTSRTSGFSGSLIADATFGQGFFVIAGGSGKLSTSGLIAAADQPTGVVVHALTDVT